MTAAAPATLVVELRQADHTLISATEAETADVAIATVTSIGKERYPRFRDDIDGRAVAHGVREVAEIGSTVRFIHPDKSYVDVVHVETLRAARSTWCQCGDAIANAGRTYCVRCEGFIAHPAGAMLDLAQERAA